MIIRRIEIDNWRGLQHFEAELLPGLNVLQGPNEAGKSTVVEALEWALYRDVVGGARVKDEAAAIVPAHGGANMARVCVSLDFDGCEVRVVKTLSPEAAHRSCRLFLNQPGKPERPFEREDAQNRLRALLESDGPGDSEKLFDASMIFAHQGEASAYAGGELSAAARQTLTAATLQVSSDGSIAPSSRLEKVRLEVEKKRKAELRKKLDDIAVESALSGSEATPAREALRELQAQRDEMARAEEQVEQLREEIGFLTRDTSDLRGLEAQARRAAKTARETRDAQQAADASLAKAQTDAREAVRACDEMARRGEEIARLRGEAERAGVELERARATLEAAKAEEAEREAQSLEAQRAHEAADGAWREAKERVEAFARYRELQAAKRDLRNARARLDELVALDEEKKSVRLELSNLGPTPSREQLWKWREEWGQLGQKKQEAAQSLRVGLSLETSFEVEWRIGEEAPETATAGLDEPLWIGGSGSIVLRIQGVGEITVSGAGREARKLAGEIEERAQRLNGSLASYGASVDELPDGFRVLEERCAQSEQVAGDLKALTEKVGAFIALHGSLQSLRGAAEDARLSWDACRAACEGLLHLLPPDLSREALLPASRQATDDEAQAGTDALRARRTHEDAGVAWNEAKTRVVRAETAFGGLQMALSHATRELERHASDGLSDEERQAKGRELERQAAQAARDLEAAQAARQALGEAMAEGALRALEEGHESLLHRLQSGEGALLERRRDLHHQCALNPRGERERLDVLVEAKRAEVARHEARLRGLALLEAAIESERQKLGRQLAGPLNERLSPWLSRIRGKETEIEFDRGGSRITRVRTVEPTDKGPRPISLAFAEHSEGLKEQVALILRLLLAGLAARRVPSKRLPIILDDPLTQSDERRREGLYGVLNEAAEELQIVFVTCHATRGLESPHEIHLGEVLSEPVLPAARTRVRKKAETNGHAKEEPATLSLWD